jgi:hypothetical protein
VAVNKFFLRQGFLAGSHLQSTPGVIEKMKGGLTIISLPLLFTLCAGSALANEDIPQEPSLSATTSSALANEAVPKKRLRFRNGPVCMCADGLTEDDILASQERNKKKLEIFEKKEDKKL